MNTDTVTYQEIKRKMSGLIYAKGSWRAEYQVNGRRRYQHLNTPDEKEAIKLRDAFYAKLAREGATVKSRKATVVNSRPTRYIYYRIPWFIRVNGVVVGYYETEEEAIAARDEYLKTACKFCKGPVEPGLTVCDTCCEKAL